MYFTVSGGPFTTEGLIPATGPGLGLLVLILIPIFWSIPEALIVGELASMIPEQGGYYRWVRRAFGPFWAFQNGWWTWLYSVLDIAIYPVLFNQYLAYFVPELGVGERWLVSLGIIWGATAINLRGALPVGRVSIVSGLFVIAGFTLLAIAAVPHIHHVPWRPLLAPGQGTVGAVGIGLSIALWNYTGWDNASTVQGEVKDASKSYPRALAFTVPLVVLGYLIPLLATLGASDWTTWEDGAWPRIAVESAGRWGRPIAAWIAVSGLVSAVALFNALLLAHSRIPVAMAEDGLMPAALGRTDARGTPVNAILVSAAVYSVCALIPFGALVVADVLLYSMALFLEFGALIALRKREPELRGDFRIPVGRKGVIALAASPMVILCIVIALEVQDGEVGLPAVAAAFVGAALGPVVYWIARRSGRAAVTLPAGQ
jgi:amino acid transporter